MEDDFDHRLAYYMEIGAIEAAGVDENGEIMFAINESAKDLAPELWEAHEHFVDKALVELYEAGHLKVDYDENLEAMISLSPEGIEIARELGVLPINMPEAPNS